MPSKALRKQDARTHERVPTALRARLFLVGEGTTLGCEVTNLSGGGAGISCPAKLPRGMEAILYIEGFGRFEAKIVRCVDGATGLRFSCGPIKRDRLLQALSAYAASGITAVTTTRREKRSALLENGHFVRADGEKIRYDAIDISSRGISIVTKIRPPVGEILSLGVNSGRVVRHHDIGIAVEFIGPNPVPQDICDGG